MLRERGVGQLQITSHRLRGKPALGVWLVMAAAMTVPDLSLNTS